MRLRSLLLALVCASALARPASAQQSRGLGFPPSYRGGLRLIAAAANAGLSAACSATVGGVSWSECFDPKGGSYVHNGSIYASWAAAGGSNNGCTFSNGTGVSGSSCYAQITTTLPANTIVTVNSTGTPTASGDLGGYGPSGSGSQEYVTLTTSAQFVYIGNSSINVGTQGGRIALCYDPSSQTGYWSRNGAAATQLNPNTAQPQANQPLFISPPPGVTLLDERALSGLACTAANVQTASAS